MHHMPEAAEIATAAAPFWLLLLAATALALATAPTGAVLLWRRMAYFGDALSHASLFGVAIALATHLPLVPAVLVTALAVAAAVVWLGRQGRLAHDALLGTFAHGLMALGLLIAFFSIGQVELHAVLFGDVLAMGPREAVLIIAGAALVLAFIVRNWQALVLSAVSGELALAEGVPARRLHVWLVLAAALLLALAARATGLLLYTSLLVMPAAAARAVAATPERMAGIGALIGLASVIGGLFAARGWGVPSGAAIVAIAFGLFLLFHLAAWWRTH